MVISGLEEAPLQKLEVGKVARCPVDDGVVLEVGGVGLGEGLDGDAKRQKGQVGCKVVSDGGCRNRDSMLVEVTQQHKQQLRTNYPWSWVGDSSGSRWPEVPSVIPVRGVAHIVDGRLTSTKGQ